jgi:hypothetical protein
MTIYKCVVGSDAGPAADSTSQSGGCDIVARAAAAGAIAFRLLLIDRPRKGRR